MQLPVGIYVISSAFAEKTGAVSFRFRGKDYPATVGVNAFSRLEDLVKVPLKAATEEFFGYCGTPILVFPAGTYCAGVSQPDVTREQLLCNYMPQAVTMLGENVGIDPNGPDKRAQNPLWKEESVFLGRNFFGAFGIRGETPGTLTIDGMVFQTAKIIDDRTGGEKVALAVKNCVFRDYLTYDLIQTEPLTDKNATRQILLQNIRCDGIIAREGQSCLADLRCGDFTVDGMYFGNTDKFPGLTDFRRKKVCGRPEEKAVITYKDCIFENCTAPAGLGFRFPEDSQMTLRMENCAFENVAPKGVSPVYVHLPKSCKAQFTHCTFTGCDDVPAILVSGEGAENIALSHTAAPGFSALWEKKLPRPNTPLPRECFLLDDPHETVDCDFAELDRLYAGTKAYHGDTHTHTDSGGTSDGETPLAEFVQQLKALDMDFAAIVDHRQMRHFFLPQWDETMLICGSEPSAKLIGKPSFDLSALHYCMLFPDKEGLGKTLDAFPEFAYTGGTEGHFTYPRFTPERFRELGEFIYSIGGLLSHAHPKQGMLSDDPLDYFISEHVALETIHEGADSYASQMNRNLWVTLLAAGKRVRTYGSTDTHEQARDDGQTTLYAKNRHSRDFFREIRQGNCAAGAAGIQMVIGHTPMGGVCPYEEGLTLEIRVGDFHRSWKKDAIYRLKVFTDRGVAYVSEFQGAAPQKLAFPVQKRAFYRLEITNETDEHLVSLSNPIWLD